MLKLRGYDKDRYAQCVSEAPEMSHEELLEREAWYHFFSVIEECNTDEATPFDAEAGYLNAFMPFVAYAHQKLSDAFDNAICMANNEHAGTVMEQCLIALGSRLLNIGLKTLVLELNRERMNGHLSGEDSHARFAAYTRIAAQPEYRTALFDRYPVLARMLTQATNYFITFVSEIVRRVDDNAMELATLLHTEAPLRLESMELDGGDSHDHGRTAAMLTINDSKVAYKPRNLSIHTMFADLTHACERHAGFLPMHVPGILDKGTYAFEEFVAKRDCTTEDEVRRYYTRFGQLLGLVWFLHGNDMHYENIIPCGEYPQIIDYETIATNYVMMDLPQDSADMVVQQRLRDSLAGSSFLPTRMILDAAGHAVDLSALNPEDQRIPSTIAVPVDLDSDQARYERQDGVFSKREYLLHINGMLADPYRYGGEMLHGFDLAMDALRAVDEAELRGIVERDANVCRILVRATNIYARFQDFIHHPSALTDMTKVEAVLENLYVFPYHNKAIFLSEYRQMMEGDIPMFTARLNSRDMQEPGGGTIGPVFERSVAERILDTYAHLEREAEFQRQLIRNALRLSVNDPLPVSPMAKFDGDSDLDVDDAETVITAYPAAAARYLHDQAVYDDTHKTVSWVAAQRVLDPNQADDVEPDFLAAPPVDEVYLGTGGAAMFLAQLANVRTGKSGDADERLARMTMHSLINRVMPSASLSAFTGPASHLYPALMLRNLGMAGNDVNDYLMRAVNYLDTYTTKDLDERIAQAKPDDKPCHTDYLTGAAGMVIAYLETWRQLGDDDILLQTVCLGRKLVMLVKQYWDLDTVDGETVYPTGAAHGLEGITVAMWRLFRATGDETFAGFAHQLWDRAMTRRAARTAAGTVFPSKWCRGDLGVLWAQNELERYGDDRHRFFTEDVEKPFVSYADVHARFANARWQDDSLCHGRSGGIDVLVSVANTTGDERYRDLAHTIARGMIAEAQARHGGFDFGRIPAFPDLSVFLGPLGAAYALLRLAHPTVPSLLSLEV
ncbi:type 2 lanthipeptide synthetase LanM [Bifidobacterium sp. UTCIF-39]|uniref:type 2 lanthipeptide synthetase LanM n=1 Tax=Bifidobacterium sp. UTCIF-39 TaxID=1465359 RepID=UPI0015E323E1|nr:type 2 lanthipeptide synthetase LanM [Bifidobacterium sp. UTCIF-39]